MQVNHPFLPEKSVCFQGKQRTVALFVQDQDLDTAQVGVLPLLHNPLVVRKQRKPFFRGLVVHFVQPVQFHNIPGIIPVQADGLFIMSDGTRHIVQVPVISPAQVPLGNSHPGIQFHGLSPVEDRLTWLVIIQDIAHVVPGIRIILIVIQGCTEDIERFEAVWENIVRGCF